MGGIAAGVVLLAAIVGVAAWKYKQQRDVGGRGGKGRKDMFGFEMNDVGGEGRRSSSLYVDKIYDSYRDSVGARPSSSRSPSGRTPPNRSSMADRHSMAHSPVHDRMSRGSISGGGPMGGSRGSFAGANPMSRASISNPRDSHHSPVTAAAQGRGRGSVSSGSSSSSPSSRRSLKISAGTKL